MAHVTVPTELEKKGPVAEPPSRERAARISSRRISRASAFLDLVDARRSIRRFSDRAVEAKALDRILHATSRAPSAGNEQAYEVAVVADAALLEKLADAANDQRFIATAPSALVFCTIPWRAGAVYGERGASLFALQDATIACAYAQLAATALGLGSVWIGSFDPVAVSAVIESSDDEIPIAILALGYAGEMGSPSARRPLDEMVRYVKR